MVTRANAGGPTRFTTPRAWDAPPKPANEAERVQAVDRLNQRRSERQPELLALRDAAQRLFGVPVVLITVIESAHQHMVTAMVQPSPDDPECTVLEGTAQDLPRECTLCQLTIMEDDHLVVADARRFILEGSGGIYPPEFRQFVEAVDGYPIPWLKPDGTVTVRGAAFYAAVPIRTLGGLNVGTFCVFDYQPRPDFSLEDLATLRQLGQLAARHMELRAVVDRPANLRLLEARLRALGARGERAEADARTVDVAVLGGGPAGVTAASRLAFHGLDVILVEPKPVFGAPTGVFSKILREAALRSGALTTWDDVVGLKARIVDLDSQRVAELLASHGVEVVRGAGRFTGDGEDPTAGPGLALEVARSDGAPLTLRARVAVVASGSRAKRCPGLPYDGRHVVDTDGLAGLGRMPTSLLVQGGGLIGVEYAMIFARLGVPVTLAIRDSRERLLPMLDRALAAALIAEMERLHIALRFDTTLQDVTLDGPSEARVRCVAVSRDATETLMADVLLPAVGRAPVTDGLGVELLPLGIEGANPIGPGGGLATDGRQRVIGPRAAVFAVGDVTGPPGLASQAVLHAQAAVDAILPALSRGLSLNPIVYDTGASRSAAAVAWTTPEIAFAGATEESARQVHGADAVVRGRGRFGETVRGSLAAVPSSWFLDLVCRRSDGRVLGVHAFGEGAADLIHFGAHVVEHERTAFDLLYQPFPAVTLHEVYRAAAQDVLERLTRELQASLAASAT